MKFWPAMKECLLELLVGRDQLESWRAEERYRKQAEMICNKYAEAFRLSQEPIWTAEDAARLSDV